MKMKMYPTKFTTTLILLIVEVMLLITSIAGSRVLTQPISLEPSSGEFADFRFKPTDKDNVRVLPLDWEFMANWESHFPMPERGDEVPVSGPISLRSFSSGVSEPPGRAPAFPNKRPPIFNGPVDKYPRRSFPVVLVVLLLVTAISLIFVGLMCVLRVLGTQPLSLMAAGFISISALIVYAATFLHELMLTFLPRGQCHLGPVAYVSGTRQTETDNIELRVNPR